MISNNNGVEQPAHKISKNLLVSYQKLLQAHSSILLDEGMKGYIKNNENNK